MKENELYGTTIEQKERKKFPLFPTPKGGFQKLLLLYPTALLKAFKRSLRTRMNR